MTAEQTVPTSAEVINQNRTRKHTEFRDPEFQGGTDSSVRKILISIGEALADEATLFSDKLYRNLQTKPKSSPFSDRSFACSSGNLVSKHLRTRSARAMADVAEQGAELKRCSFCCPSDSIGAWIDLAGEGKWLRSASGRLLSVAVTGRERFSGDQNQRKYLSTMEPRKVEIGAEALLRISREFGKTIEWLPTR